MEWNEEIQRFEESAHGDLMNSRLFDILDAIADMRDYATEHGIECVLHAGDMFHTRATVDVTAINATRKMLSTLKQRGITVIAIAGNHDQVSAAMVPESSLRSLSDVILPVECPTMLEKTVMGDLRREILRIAAIPYSKDKSFVMKSVTTLLRESQSEKWGMPILLAHAGIDGGVTGSGMRSMKDVYSLSDFQSDKFRFCVFGHYHQPQFLSDNAIYCGSICQNDFGDERKGFDNSVNNGFWVLNTKSLGKGAFEFVPSHSPRFITISDKSELAKYDPDVIETAHIRVRATDSASEEIKEAIQEAGNAEPPKMEICVEKGQVVRSEISIKDTPAEAATVYAKENGADNSTLAIGLEILKAVMA